MRANCIPLDPAIRVLSRSKKAAARGATSLAGCSLKGRSAPVDLDDDRVALTAAGADRGDAETAAAATQLMDEGADQTGAGGADRVAEGDRPAVDVDVLLADSEDPHRADRDRGEGLVDLPEVDVLGALADLLQGFQRRVAGRPRQVGEVVGDGAVGEDLGKRSLAFLF